MTIKEYYADYKKNSKYGTPLSDGQDKTIDGFYQNCISKNMLQAKDVLAWHEMFLRYIELPDAIFWIRDYERGELSTKNAHPLDENGNRQTFYFRKGKKAGQPIEKRWTNRRACYTEFADGFAYVFISNFDTHEIYNMISKGVVPDEYEFLELMQTFAFPLHYDAGKSCEESDILAYKNNVGTPIAGVLTAANLYLAHINGIKEDYLRQDGTYKPVVKAEHEWIYPQGGLADWKADDTDGIMKRKLDCSRNLTPEQKELVKAHFLRFVDPLNYFVVPAPKNETNAVGGRIGEYKKLTAYMDKKHEELYGKAYADFKAKALIKPNTCTFSGSDIIDVNYGPLPRRAKSGGAAYDFDSNAAMIIEYLKDPKTSFIKLEGKYFGKKSHGTIPWKIIRSFEIPTEYKGILSKRTIDELIKEAGGKLKETLQKIKNLGV